MYRRGAFAAFALAAFLLGGLALAEGPEAAGQGARPAMGAEGGGMMGMGKMAIMGNRERGDMMAGCPMMGGPMTPTMPMMGSLAEPGVDVKVDKRDDGVALTLTSKDESAVRRLQKRAEILRLMHELAAEEAAGAPN